MANPAQATSAASLAGVSHEASPDRAAGTAAGDSTGMASIRTARRR